MSETNKHTPGPWVIGAENCGDGFNIEASDGRFLAHTARYKSQLAKIQNVESPEAQGNARLIAAAPDLLEACEQAAEWLESWASAEPYLSIIRAAIAKATEPKP